MNFLSFITALIIVPGLFCFFTLHEKIMEEYKETDNPPIFHYGTFIGKTVMFGIVGAIIISILGIDESIRNLSNWWYCLIILPFCWLAYSNMRPGFE